MKLGKVIFTDTDTGTRRSWLSTKVATSQQDPRFVTDVATTRARFHDSPNSMYGKTVAGVVLGSRSPPPGGQQVAVGPGR